MKSQVTLWFKNVSLLGGSRKYLPTPLGVIENSEGEEGLNATAKVGVDIVWNNTPSIKLAGLK